MQIRTEAVIFAISFLSFCSMITMSVWKSAASVSRIQHNLEKKDILLESLQDKLTLHFNGLKERFEHFAQRSRGEVQALEKRVQQMERFLQKSTNFDPRD
ncbi:hypothetical protein [Myxacorys almedinensis]|uniref:Uncharacterized protein n=1 Tax=Myxacorys almedinensis A TaxID=2690445 RepID=A0A8J8CIQ6_9CYAN|nr:hypothetical protein [Myxacorys almedinensis]NDJ16791.1 hypothetical protein [Myxacorys almedinensis A]